MILSYKRVRQQRSLYIIGPTGKPERERESQRDGHASQLLQMELQMDFLRRTEAIGWGGVFTVTNRCVTSPSPLGVEVKL